MHTRAEGWSFAMSPRGVLQGISDDGGAVSAAKLDFSICLHQGSQTGRHVPTEPTYNYLSLICTNTITLFITSQNWIWKDEWLNEAM